MNAHEHTARGPVFLALLIALGLSVAAAPAQHYGIVDHGHAVRRVQQ